MSKYKVGDEVIVHYGEDAYTTEALSVDEGRTGTILSLEKNIKNAQCYKIEYSGGGTDVYWEGFLVPASKLHKALK